MGAARKRHGYVVIMHLDGTFTLDEMAVQLFGITGLKTAKLLRQHGIERIGDQGHQHIEVDLHQDR